MAANFDKAILEGINVFFRNRRPLICNSFNIKWCDASKYFGSAFISDGNRSSAVLEHAHLKTCHLLKFIYFIKNNRHPFLCQETRF